MKLRPNLTPEQNFIRLVFVRILSVSAPLGEFATWVLTGTIAILGAVVVKVDTISKVLSTSSLHWGLTLLVISLLAGVFTKHLGIALSAGLSLSEELFDELMSSEGINTIQSMTSSFEELKLEMTSAFLPPLNWIMKKAFDHGLIDPLAGEKRFVRLFSIQVYAFWTQSISGVLGLLILAFGIA
jgi:hypothetical protein